ncbi:hypothetical protein [Alicyclobacillus macrosporangiidus]
MPPYLFHRISDEEVSNLKQRFSGQAH